MNKKALIFHWIIVFGFFIALGVFFYFSQTTNLNLEPKGTWQIDFLNNYYFLAEQDLINSDFLVKQAAGDSIHRLATNAGFINKIPCGKIGPQTRHYVVWNKKKDFASCAPSLSKDFITDLTERVNKKSPKKNYNTLKLEKNFILGKANQKTIKSTKTDKYYALYTYDLDFEIDLGFDLQEEYNLLRKIANNLVAACNKKSNLETCIKNHIKNKKLTKWKFSECTNKFYSEARKVAFCVESKNSAYKNKQLMPIKYYFALDFATQST